MYTNLLSLTTQFPRKYTYPFSEISKIIRSDKKLLEKTLQLYRPNSKNYEDSWGYIIQSTRYGGFKWYDPTSNSLIFFGRKSDNDPTLVVPNFFAEPKYLASVLAKIQKEVKTSKTILKNINPDEIYLFTPYDFRPYKKNEYWNSQFKYDDQTYPQGIIDLKQVKEAQGKKYHPLRRALNKMPDLSFRKYKISDKKAVLELFALKDRYLNGIQENGMYFVSHEMYPNAAIDKYIIIDNETGEILGFTATSDINHDNTTLVASIFKNNLKFNTSKRISDTRSYIVSIWGIYHTFCEKYKERYKLINVGGNEAIRAYTFLHRTFHPVEESQKTHLVFDS